MDDGNQKSGILPIGIVVGRNYLFQCSADDYDEHGLPLSAGRAAGYGFRNYLGRTTVVKYYVNNNHITMIALVSSLPEMKCYQKNLMDILQQIGT